MLSEAKKNRILELSSTTICSQCTASLLLLLQNVIDTENNNKSADSFTAPIAISEIQSYTKKSLFSLEEDLSLPVEDVIKKIDKTNELRKIVSELYVPIPKYMVRISAIMKLLKNEQKLRFAINEAEKNDMYEGEIDFKLFYDKCRSSLKSLNEWSYDNCTKYLFKVIPMRMSKVLFYDMLAETLKSNFKESNSADLDKTLDSIRKMLTIPKNLDDIEDNDAVYIEIEEFIQANLKLNPKDLSDTELEDLINEIMDKYVAYINFMEETLTYCLQDLSSLVIFYASELNFEQLTSNPTHKDLYNTICQQLKKELTPLEIEAYRERINDDLDEAIEIEIDKVIVATDKKSNFMNKISDDEDFDKETQQILKLSTLINHYYLETLEDTLYEHLTADNLDDVGEILTSENLDKSINDFIEEIKTAFNELSTPFRKIQMQVLKGLISFNTNVDYVVDEIKNAIDSCSTFEQKLVLVEDIHDVFANYNKSLFDYDNNNDDTHHHHEDCDCGHHHH